MKIALFSDVHGNDVAFRQLVEEPEFASADIRVFLGDAVGYLPGGAQVIERLRDVADVAVQGNHDAMITGSLPIDPVADTVYRLNEQRESLDRAALTYLAALPTSATLEGAFLVHGSPASPLLGRLHADTPATAIGTLPAHLVFVGQTHRPFVRAIGAAQLVNVGSVGLPRDGSGRGCYAVWDSAGAKVQLHTFPLDANAILREYPGVHPDVRARLAGT